MDKHGTWVRDGTIMGPEGVEIDLRDETGENWISIKGDSDKTVEKIAKVVLEALNKKEKRG